MGKYDNIVNEIIRGKKGYGETRKNKLRQEGFSSQEIEEIRNQVNEKMESYVSGGSSKKPSYSQPSYSSSRPSSEPSYNHTSFAPSYSEKEDKDNGHSFNRYGVSQYAHDKNYYYVDDALVSDYAPYGRDSNGTPYRADGTLLGSANNRGTGEGYDPTGKSDPRNFKDTLKPGNNYHKSWASHSPSFDPDGYEKDSKMFNDYVDDYGMPPGSFGKNSIYEELYRRQKNLREQQMQEAISRLDSQKRDTSKIYDDIAAAAYAQKMKRKELLEGQSDNIATGTADSLALQSELGYQNDILSNDYKKAMALADIDKNISDVRLSGDAALASDFERYALMALEEQKAREREAREMELYQMQRNDRLAEKAAQRAIQEKKLSMGSYEKKNSSNSKMLDELWKQYGFYSQIGDENSASKILSRINDLNFPNDITPSVPKDNNLGRSKRIVIPGLKQTFASAQDAISTLAQMANVGVISMDAYNRYRDEILG